MAFISQDSMSNGMPNKHGKHDKYVDVEREDIEEPDAWKYDSGASVRIWIIRTISVVLSSALIIMALIGRPKHNIEQSGLLKYSDYPAFGQVLGSTFDRSPTLHPDPRLLTTVKHGAVACDVPLCSTLGSEILQKGGSAVDAAITTALCIGSINSHSSGIGGGGFMTVRHPNGSSVVFNFREMAPAAANKTMYNSNARLAQVGGLAVAVPGEIAGLDAAYKRYSSGKLSWRQLFEPVIELNRRGFPVSDLFETAIDRARESFKASPAQWEFLHVPDRKTGELRLAREGDIIRRFQYANTLETIAQNGSSSIFYDPSGPIAPILSKFIRASGGIVTPEDFANYSVVVEPALKTEFLGLEVVTTPNPTSGPALVLGLKIMEGFSDNRTSKDAGDIETQRLIESMKWLSAGRTELGDSSNNNSARIAEITSQEWADKVRRNISDSHTYPWKYYGPSYEGTDPHGTAHFSVLDKSGMAVAMTTTVNLEFGAMIVDPATGIVLNSEMDDFSLPNTDNAYMLKPSIFNYVAPFRRPLSSTCPTIVTNTSTNVPELIIGAAGGSRIPTAVLQAIVRKYQYGLPLLETIALPRFHHQLVPETAFLEEVHNDPSGYTDKVAKGLRSKGHNVELFPPYTAMNGIYRDPESGDIHAVSDWWRKRGLADGY